MQGACHTAKEDFRDMLRILTRNTPEPIRVSAFVDPQSDPAPGAESHLSSHHELKSAVALLLHAAQQLDPDEVKFDITRLIFNQVGPLTCCSILYQSLLANVRCLSLPQPCDNPIFAFFSKHRMPLLPIYQ